MKLDKADLKWILAPLSGLLYGLSANLLFTVLKLSPTAGINLDPEAAVFFLANPVMLLILEVIISPVVEEILFRKLFYGRLKRRIRPVFAALLSSAVFALLHMSPVHLVYTFLFGLLLCGIYDRTDHVLPCIFAHFAANLLAVLVDAEKPLNLFLQRNLIWAAPLAMVLFLICIYFLFRKEKERA